MSSILDLIKRINFITKISILVGLFAVLPITAAVNTPLSFDNFVFQVSFSSSPEDEDGDNQITICEGASVTFTDTSTEVPAGATYDWSFPGGSVTSADTAGPHDITFDTAGAYTVILDINGTTSEMIVNVSTNLNIEPNIVADGWGQSTFNGTTYFTYCSDATSTNPNFEANFAFQTTSTNTTTSSVHTLTDENGVLIYSFTGENFNLPNQFIDHYVNTGFAQVIYQIQEGSCIYNTTFNLYIGASPTATITNEGIPILCTPGDVVYTISPGQQNGPGTVYTIEISDGSPPVIFNHPPPATYTHTYNAVSCGQTDVVFNNTPYPNAFEISITAENACGQSTSGFAPIYIESGPEAEFEFIPNPPNNTICQNVTLTANDTTIEGSNITSDGECNDFYKRFWQIIAPDGSILTSASNGTIDTNIYASVIGHMGYVPGGIDITAESASSWSSNAATSIDITFLQPGNYEVTLFTGSSGQSNRCGITSFSQTICVTPEVIADFELSTYLVCGPANVSSTNNSSLTGCDNQNIYEWTVTYQNPENCPLLNTPNWNFANGTDESSFEPEFQFNTPGVYEISLTVSLETNNDGTSCEPDTMVKTIKIKEKPQTTLPTLELCETESYTFDLEVFNCYADQDTTFLWDFQGASELSIDDTTILNPTVTFSTAGNYPYTLTLTNECGENELSGTIEIYQEVFVSVSGPENICINSDIELSGTISGGATSGLWTSSVPGGSFAPSSNDLITTYTPPLDYVGVVVLTLTSEDPIGPCPEVSNSVVVDVQLQAVADAGTYDPFCVNTPIQLAGTIGGAASSATWSADVSGVFFPSANDLNATFTPDTANFIGNITFTLTTDNPTGPCLSTFDLATVEVIPLGQVEPINDFVFCHLQTTQLISFVTIESGTTFSWTNDNTNIGLPTSGLNEIPSFVAENTTNAPIIATITVTPNIIQGSTLCDGPTETFTITVNPDAQVDSPIDLVLCNDDVQPEISFNTQNTGGITTYSWSIDTSIGLNPISGTGSIPSFTAVNSGTSPIVATVTVIPTYNNAGVDCSEATETFTITVNPDAQVDSPIDLVLCNDDVQPEISFNTQNTGGITTYSWSIDTSIGLNPISGTGSIPSFTAVNSGTSPIVATVTVIPTYNNAGVDCSEATETFTITVNPDAQVDSPIDLVLCNDDVQPEISFNTQNTGGITTYSWSIDTSIGLNPISGTGSIPSFTAVNSGTSPIVATVTVIPTYNNAGVDCSEATETFTITVNPDAQVDSPIDLVLCNDDVQPEISFNTQNTGGITTYSWSIDTSIGLNPISGTGSIPSFTAVNSGTSPIVATVTVIPTYNNAGVDCSEATETFTITVNPEPAMDNVLNQTICGGAAFETPTYNSNVSGATYSWELTSTDVPGEISGFPSPNGTGELIGSVIQNSGATSFTLTYNLSVFYDGCLGNTVPFLITVDPAPNVDFSLPNQTVCSGGTTAAVSLTSSTPDVSIEWTRNSPAGLTGFTTGDDQGTTEIPSYTLQNTTSAPIDLIFTAQSTTTSAAGCPGSTTQYVITINPTAEMDAIDDVVVYCNGGITNEIVFSTPQTVGNTDYSWTINTDIGIPLSGTGNIPSFTAENNTNNPIVALVTVSPSFSNTTDVNVLCDGLDQQFTITVNPTPEITNPESSQTICSDEDTSLVTWQSSITNGEPTTYVWNFISATTGLTGHLTGSGNGDLPLMTINHAGIDIGEVVYEVIPTAYGCDGAPFNYTTYVNPDVEIGNSETNQTLCSEDTSSEVIWILTNPALETSTTFDWALQTATVPAGTTGLIASGQGNLPSMDITIISTTSAAIEYIITPIFDDCTGTPFTYTLNIDPRPVMDAIDPQIICSETAFDTPILNSNVSGSVFDWELLNPSSIPSTIIGYPTDNTQLLIASSITNNGTDPFTLEYQFTPSFNGCDGDSQVFSITINPSPATELDLDAQEICSGGTSLPFIASSPSENVTFSWEITSDISGLSGITTTSGTANSSGEIPSFSGVIINGMPSIDIIVEVVATTENIICGGPPTLHTITVVQDPVAIISSDPPPICVGGTIDPITTTYTGGTGTPSYQWYDNSSGFLQVLPGENSSSFDPGIMDAAGTFSYLVVIEFLDASTGCNQTSSDLVTVEVVNDPVLVNPLPTQTICENTIPQDLVSSTNGGTGTYTFEWFESSNPTIVLSSDTNVTTSTFTPPTDDVGTYNYYVVVTTEASGCETTSSISEVIVNAGASVSVQPLAEQTVCLDGATSALEVQYTNGVGMPAYQWYSNTTCDTSDLSTPIAGETSNTYTPPSDTVGSVYYFVQLTFADGGCGAITSDCALVNVVPDPEVSITSTVPIPICEGGAIDDIVITTTGGTGTPSYEWWTSDVFGSRISIATNSTNDTSFNPGVFTVSGTYYYVAVVNFDGSGCNQVVSLPITVEVVADPIIDTLLPTQTICENTSPITLEGIVSGGTGAYNYQWYESPSDTAIVGATTSTFTPPTDDVGTFNYYVVVTTEASGCETTSSISEVIVNAGASVSVQPLAEQTVCLDGATSALEVQYTNGVGMPAYQWYSNTTCDTSDLSTPIAGETSNTYAPPSDTVGSVYYFVQLTFADGGCGAITSDCALVNIGEIPVIENISETICSLDTFTVTPTNGGGLNANDIVPTPTLYTWTISANGSILGASNNSTPLSSISQTLENTTNVSQQITYTVTPISDAIGNCIGTPFEITVTVDPVPTLSDEIITICSADPIVYIPSGDGTSGSDIVPANTTYTWTFTDNPNVTGETNNTIASNEFSQNLINTVQTQQTVIYQVTPISDLGCAATSFTVTVVLDPVPSILNQYDEICSGETFEIIPTNNLPSQIVPVGTTYTWVTTGNTNLTGWSDETTAQSSIPQTLINTNNISEQIVYVVTPQSGICSGSTFEVVIDVLPSPIIDVVTPSAQLLCSGDNSTTVTFGATVAGTGFEYNLTNVNIPAEITGYEANVNGVGNLPSMTLTNGLANPYVLNYEVLPIAEGCNGNPTQFSITINPSPQVEFSQLDQILCNNNSSDPIDLTSPTSNVIIEWTRNNPVGLTGFVIGDDQGNNQIPSYTLNNTTDSAIDLVFTATATTDDSSTCVGNEFIYTITINPTAEIDTISNQTICSQSAFQDVFVTSPTQPTTSITYAWEVTSAGPNLSGYTASSGPIGITNPILGEIIFNASNTAEDLIYTLTPYYDNCEGTTQTFTITVDPTPEIFDVNTTICSEETFDVIPENGLSTASTIVPVNTTYTWTVLPNPNVTGQSDETQPQNNISQTLINLTNVAQDVVYIVTPTSADGCEGAPFEVTVTVETRPIIEDKIVGACSGDAFLVEPTDNSPLEIVPSNTLYTWTILPGTDLVDLTGYSDQTTGVSSISQTLVNLTDESKTIVYEVIPISGTCEGLPFEIEVTVSPRPFVDDIIVTPICSEDTFTVIPETAVPSPNNIVPIGITFTWTVADNPNVIGDTDEVNPQSQISQTLINTSSTTQTVVYTVVPSSSGCDGPSFTITIDVKPRPFIVSGPDTQDTQCSGDPFVISPQDGVPTSATIVPAGTQYTWTTLGNPDLLGWSNQTLPVGIITQTLENTTNQIQQIIYTIIPEADGCVGPSFDAVITIEPKPFVPDVIVDICDATSSSNTSYILSPQNGLLPDASTIIPDATTYTWGPPIVTGGLTGGSTGSDEAFFDSGVLENPTTNLQTAIYTVTPNYYTVLNPTTPQCSGEPFTVTITVSPSPEINEVITNIACSYSDPLCGASIEISPVGIGPFTYSWVSIEGNPLNNPTDEDQFDLCPGTYELTITDASSCSYVFEYEIVPPVPVEFTLITQTDISCNNVNTLPCDGSIEVSTTGGTLPYNLVEWYTETIPGSGVFDSGPLINIINPYNLVNACEGNYVLKILDANGCEFVSDVYTIEQAVEPIILTETLSNYNGFNIDCNAANSGTITVDISGGSGVFIYSFVDAIGNVLEADTILSSPATLVFDFLIAGDYSLTVEDLNCTDQIVRNYTLTQPDELIITATLVDPVSCFGGLATYNVTATGGVPPYTGTGLQSVLSGPVTFIVSDANGCEDDFSTVVNEPTELLATYVVDDAPCFEDTGQIIVTPTGGTGVLTVNLYNNNNIFITSLNTTQGNSVTFDQLAETYFYDVVDENNCSYGPEVVLVDEPDPIIVTDFEVVQPDCNTVPAWEFNNGSICITITGGTNPFPIGTGWVDNGGGQWCLNNLSAGTYPIDVTDINNCLLQNSIPDITLVRPPEITAVLTNTTDIDCDTDTATQINTIIVNGGVPPYQITWSGGIVDAANPFVMETSVPGNYSAFVIDQYGLINGCPPIEFPLDPITFFEFGIADFTLSSDNSAFCGIYAINDPIQFNNISSGDIVSYTWNFGDGSPEFNGPNAPDHTYNAIGTYTISLTVEDLYGCFDTYSETVEITKGYEIIIPNGFTPNGDGINETIRPVTICMTEIKMSIYDTWGSLIYAETSDEIYGWDGTIDGKPAENGNYIMVVIATTYNGALIELNGPVTLIK